MKKQICAAMIALILLVAALFPANASVQALDANPYADVVSEWDHVAEFLSSFFQSMGSTLSLLERG